MRFRDDGVLTREEMTGGVVNPGGGVKFKAQAQGEAQAQVRVLHRYVREGVEAQGK